MSRFIEFVFFWLYSNRCLAHTFQKNAVKRIPVTPDRMKNAVKSIIAGNSIKGAARAFNLNVMTLKRYYRRQSEVGVDSISYQPDFGRTTRVFSKEEESMLADYIIKASKMHVGLTARHARTLAYEFAVQNDKKAPPNWGTNQMAGYD